MGENQNGAIYSLNDFSHGKGLARAGNPQQNLMLLSSFNPSYQLFDSANLVPFRLKLGD